MLKAARFTCVSLTSTIFMMFFISMPYMHVHHLSHKVALHLVCLMLEMLLPPCFSAYIR